MKETQGVLRTVEGVGQVGDALQETLWAVPGGRLVAMRSGHAEAAARSIGRTSTMAETIRENTCDCSDAVAALGIGLNECHVTRA